MQQSLEDRRRSGPVLVLATHCWLRISSNPGPRCLSSVQTQTIPCPSPLIKGYSPQTTLLTRTMTSPFAWVSRECASFLSGEQEFHRLTEVLACLRWSLATTIAQNKSTSVPQNTVNSVQDGRSWPPLINKTTRTLMLVLVYSECRKFVSKLVSIYFRFGCAVVFWIEKFEKLRVFAPFGAMLNYAIWMEAVVTSMSGSGWSVNVRFLIQLS